MSWKSESSTRMELAQHVARSVLFVSDVLLYREALAAGLRQIEGLDLAGHCPSDEALDWLATERAEVVLVDATLEMGLDLARNIHAILPRVPVIGLAIGGASPRIIECAEAGFTGFVASDVGIGGLVAAVERAMMGELTCSPRIAGLLFERLAKRCSADAPQPSRMNQAAGDTSLTVREEEVAELIDGGLTNKEIALRLRISAATVKNHVHNILEKLAVPRRAAIRGRLGHAIAMRVR